MDAINKSHFGTNFNPVYFIGAKGELKKAVLTQREYDVLQGLHLRNKELAARLGVSEATAKMHVKSLCRHLEAENRTSALKAYLEADQPNIHKLADELVSIAKHLLDEAGAEKQECLRRQTMDEEKRLRAAKSDGLEVAAKYIFYRLQQGGFNPVLFDPKLS